MIREISTIGYIPSFCTACYRKGRTGSDFMDLAKPGLIKQYCLPNALSTFAEYLEDYASPETREIGLRTIEQHITNIDHKALQRRARMMVDEVFSGKRDVLI